jgi:hypothetical protein
MNFGGKTLMMVDKAIREAVQFLFNSKLELSGNLVHEYANCLCLIFLKLGY